MISNIPNDPDKIEIRFKCLRAQQPIGDLLLASVPHSDLIKFTYFDVRRVIQEERDVERYLGIQRPLRKDRVSDLQEYVNFLDASFPTSIIVAINEVDYVEYDEKCSELILRNFRENEKRPSIPIRMLGRVIDGQHRIAGLEGFSGKSFDVPVTIFLGSDIADQAHIFSTVNLEQTKVQKSLVYDLYELARTRSPQKTAHNITVALDRDEGGPLFERIKRLGGATVGRTFEPISQATFVEGLMSHITKDPKGDRDRLLRGKSLERADSDETYKLVFRNLFIADKDLKILELVSNYFEAVRSRWPKAWDDKGKGAVLNRTNGVRALLRFLRYAYTKVAAPGEMVSAEKFKERIFDPIELSDKDFIVENFPPGTSGEAKLFRVLRGKEKL